MAEGTRFVEYAEGEKGRKMWDEVDDYARSGRLKAREMAALLGIEKATSYRAYKSMGKMPVAAWHQFQQLLTNQPHLFDHEETLDRTARIMALLPEAIEVGEGGEAYLIIVHTTHPDLIALRASSVESVLGSAPRCAHEGCENRFVRRSWNHKYCHQAGCPGE